MHGRTHEYNLSFLFNPFFLLAIFFLRYICPALSLPSPFASVQLTEEMTSHFRVISRVLQNLVADSFFENDQMRQYNPYLESRRDAMDYLMHTLCCRPQTPSDLEESVLCLRSILTRARTSFSSISSPLPRPPLSPHDYRTQSTSSLLCSSLSTSTHSSPRMALLASSSSPLEDIDLSSLPSATNGSSFQVRANCDENAENIRLVRVVGDDLDIVSPAISVEKESWDLSLVDGCMGGGREKENRFVGGGGMVIYFPSHELERAKVGEESLRRKTELMQVATSHIRGVKSMTSPEKELECISFSDPPIDLKAAPRYSSLNAVSSPLYFTAHSYSSPRPQTLSQFPFLIPSSPLVSSPLPSPSRRLWRVLFDFLQGKESKMRSKVREYIVLNDFLIQYHAFSSSPSSSLPPSHPSCSLTPSSPSKAIFEAMACLKNLSRALFFYFANDSNRTETDMHDSAQSSLSTITTPLTTPHLSIPLTPSIQSDPLAPFPSNRQGKLEEILYNSEYREAFYVYLKRNLMAEPFEMWMAIEHLSVSANKKREFLSLCEEYVLPHSPSPAPLSHLTVELLRRRYSSLTSPSFSSPSPASSLITYRADDDYSFLLSVSQELWAVMAFSCLPSFVLSGVWRAISCGVYVEAEERSREKAEWFFGSEFEGSLCRSEVVTVVRKDYLRRKSQTRKVKTSRVHSSILSRFHKSSNSPVVSKPSKEKKIQRNLSSSSTSTSSPLTQPKFSKQHPPSSSPLTSTVASNSSTSSSSGGSFPSSSGFSSSFSPSSSRPPSLLVSSGPMSLSVRRSTSQALSSSNLRAETNGKLTSNSSSFTVQKDSQVVSVMIKAPMQCESEEKVRTEKRRGSGKEDEIRLGSGKAVGFLCYV